MPIVSLVDWTEGKKRENCRFASNTNRQKSSSWPVLYSGEALRDPSVNRNSLDVAHFAGGRRITTGGLFRASIERWSDQTPTTSIKHYLDLLTIFIPVEFRCVDRCDTEPSVSCTKKGNMCYHLVHVKLKSGVDSRLICNRTRFPLGGFSHTCEWSNLSCFAMTRRISKNRITDVIGGIPKNEVWKRIFT